MKERKLAAIARFDVVAYSRLMGVDETSTLESLNAHRSQLIDRLVANYRGQIVKPIGDGLLAEFASVVNAVNCAVHIQRDMIDRNETVPENRKMVFRIGINIGDVICDDEGIHGDGVNVATRLEALAEPGGICVSEAVRDQMRGKSSYDFEDLGDQDLKNIVHPVRVFRVLIDGKKELPTRVPRTSPPTLGRLLAILSTTLLVLAAGASSWLGSSETRKAKFPIQSKPSVAILPLYNVSGNPAYAELSQGITEDIVTGLSKFSGLIVVSANAMPRPNEPPPNPRTFGEVLGVQYVVEGSIQGNDDELHVYLQVSDTTTSEYVWAERYDHKAGDLLDIQNEISRKIVEVIGPISTAQGRLLQNELDRISDSSTAADSAYQLLVKAQKKYEQFSAKGNREAQVLLEKAIAQAPHDARPIAKLSWIHILDFWNDWATNPDESLNLAVKTAQKAIATNSSYAEGRRAYGVAKLLKMEFGPALASLQKARELNPSPNTRVYEGWAKCYSGQAEEGLRLIEDVISGGMYHPEYFYSMAGLCLSVLGRYEEAIKAYEKQANPSAFTKLFHSAACAQVGRYKCATDLMKEFRAVEPTYTIEKAAKSEPFRFKKDLEGHLNRLERAGLP